MSGQGFNPKLVWSTAALAFGLWFFTFFLDLFNFWIKIGLSVAVLTAVSARAGTIRDNRLEFDRTAFFQGIVTAVMLYGIFLLGREVSSSIFSFAPHQIGAIYGKGEGVPQAAVFFLLLLVTGPGEEIYWRGFLQRNLMERYGEMRGFLLTGAIYCAVHIWSFNFMLIGASAVAGVFWGLLYLKLKRLDTLIICHSVWSAFIFAVFPLA